MNRFDKLSFKYVIFAFPLVLILLIWGATGDPDRLSTATGISGAFWNILGWIFLFWILISLYLTLKMVISKEFRAIILSKYTKMEERDERESIIVGDAAKFSFLSTLAILLLFLFLSLFTITVGKYPEALKAPGKNGYISVGMSFYPFGKEAGKKEVKDDGQIIWNYTGVPLSNSMMILLIILWQIGSYRLAIRKEILD